MPREIPSSQRGLQKSFMPEIVGGRYRDRAFWVTGLEQSKQAGVYEAWLGNCRAWFDWDLEISCEITLGPKLRGFKSVDVKSICWDSSERRRMCGLAGDWQQLRLGSRRPSGRSNPGAGEGNRQDRAEVGESAAVEAKGGFGLSVTRVEWRQRSRGLRFETQMVQKYDPVLLRERKNGNAVLSSEWDEINPGTFSTWALVWIPKQTCPEAAGLEDLEFRREAEAGIQHKAFLRNCVDFLFVPFFHFLKWP